MKHWWFFLLVILLPACNTISTKELEPQKETPTPPSRLSNLPDLGEAPELANEVWLNTSDPLKLADLRGKVVLLDMWTFG